MAATTNRKIERMNTTAIFFMLNFDTVDTSFSYDYSLIDRAGGVLVLADLAVLILAWDMV